MSEKKERNVTNCIYDNILEHIGNTPMVRLNRIPQSEGLECEIGILILINAFSRKM